MRKEKNDFINMGYWICMKIYFVGTICCGGANELANYFGQNSPHKIYLYRNPLTFFVVPAFLLSAWRGIGIQFSICVHPFVCPLILQHLHQP